MPAAQPFSPNTQATVSITSAVTTANVALVPKHATTVRIKNVDATNTAFVAFGISTIVATVPSGATGGSFPVGPGESIILSIGDLVTHAAAICGAGTPIVYFTPGNGI